MAEKFADRRSAGRALADSLSEYVEDSQSIVLALPRGGVEVAFEVAKSLNVPLDVFVVRKLGVPGHEELAMGAIAAGGVQVVDERLLSQLGMSEEMLQDVIRKEGDELRRRESEYRGSRGPLSVAGRKVILVDDGLATGSTMRAAVKALRRMGPDSITVAVPVGAASTCDELRKHADEVVCLATPEPFYAVGMWYEDFSQTTDVEVCELLDKASRFSSHTAGHGRRGL